MSELKQVTQFPVLLNDANEKYRQRRRKQMIAFFGTTALTLLCSRLAYRGVQTRKYVPQLFNANHIPPQFSFQRDAILAVTHASLLATTSFAMIITGVCWSWDVSTVKEFGFKVKRLLGGDTKEKEISNLPLDEESASVQDAINKFLNGEISEEEILQEKE